MDPDVTLMFLYYVRANSISTFSNLGFYLTRPTKLCPRGPSNINYSETRPILLLDVVFMCMLSSPYRFDCATTQT